MIQTDAETTPLEQTFPIATILSIATGVLVTDIGEVYRILNWMSGESIYTHQLPRVGTEAAAVLLARHPQLASAVGEAGVVNQTNWPEWLQTWTKRYGTELSVPMMTADQHERIDPLSELAEKVDPSRIIVIGKFEK